MPICEGNADYDCLTPEGRVICWSHDMQASIGEERPDLAAWIEQVWIHDYAAAEPDAAVGDGGMSLGRWRARR